MGRKKLPDRAWHRWNGSEGRWEIVTVRGGRRHCTLCPPGTSEQGAERAAAIITADLDTGAVTSPVEWGDVDDEQSAVSMFLKASETGEHRARPKRGGRKTLRPSSRDWYVFRLREAGRVLARLKGADFDPLALSASDGVRFVAVRSAEIAPSGKPVRPATINAEIEAVTILQRWFVLRRWVERATWEDVARLDVVSSRAPLRPDEVGAFLRAATKLGADPRAATDWFAPRPSTRPRSISEK